MRILQNWKEPFFEHIPFGIILFGIFLMPLLFHGGLRQPLVLPKNMLLFATVGGALFFWLLRAVINKRLHIRKSVLDVPLLLFATFVLISSFLSASVHRSFFGFTDEYVIHAMSLLAGITMVWLLIQEIRTKRRWELLLTGLFTGTAISLLTFLLQSYGLINLPVINTVSNIISVFGIYSITVATVAFGMLLLKKTSLPIQILAFVVYVANLWLLFRIDFPLLWGFAIASTFLIVFTAVLHLSYVRKWLVIVMGILGLISAWFFVQDVPPTFSIRSSLPAEITLSAPVSWNMLSNSLIKEPKVLLIGHGSGEFSSLFSLYRPAGFNLNSFVGQLRFKQPFNSLLDVISSTGLLGAVSFSVIIFVMFGVIVTSIQLTRRKTIKQLMFTRTTFQSYIGMQGLYIGVAWLLLTGSFLFVYLDAAVWVLWWSLLGFAFVGVSVEAPRLVREKEISIRLSDGQHLLTSFIIVGMFVSGAIISVFSYRYILAELLYTQATSEREVFAARELVEKSITLRPNYAPYQIANARLALEMARQESEKVNPNETLIVNTLAAAVNNMKLISEHQPQDVAVWETLSLLYINSRIFAPEANEWALQATEKAIALEPTNSGLYLQAGNAHEFAKRYQDAKRSYQKAIQLKDSDIQGYLQMAALLEKEGDISASLQMYKQALTVQPDNITARYQSGRILFNRGEKGDYEAAKNIWEQALTINPRHVNTLYSLGLLHEQQREWRDAVSYYEKILTINPNNTEAKARLNALR